MFLKSTDLVIIFALQIEPALVKDAVSLYCRLGFARKKNAELDTDRTHPSWYPLVEMRRGGASIRCGSVLSIGSDEEEDDSLIRELNQARYAIFWFTPPPPRK